MRRAGSPHQPSPSRSSPPPRRLPGIIRYTVTARSGKAEGCHAPSRRSGPGLVTPALYPGRACKLHTVRPSAASKPAPAPVGASAGGFYSLGIRWWCRRGGGHAASCRSRPWTCISGADLTTILEHGNESSHQFRRTIVSAAHRMRISWGIGFSGGIGFWKRLLRYAGSRDSQVPVRRDSDRVPCSGLSDLSCAVCWSAR